MKSSRRNPAAEPSWLVILRLADLSRPQCSVEWRNAADRLRCFACGCEYDGGRLDPCPSCGGNGIVIVHADELTVLDWMT